MKRKVILSLLPILLDLACTTTQTNLEASAKISKADAAKLAIAKAPNGTIKESELEKEKGRLVWSFDIATPGTSDIHEVQVDAVTGQIVSVERETPAQQQAERQHDKQGKE